MAPPDYNLFWGNLDVGMVLVDDQLRIRYVNPWLTARWPADTPVPATLDALLGQASKRQRIAPLIQQTIQSGRVHVLSQVIHKYIVPLKETRFSDGLMRQSAVIRPFMAEGQRWALLQLRDESDRLHQLQQLQQEIQRRAALETYMRAAEDRLAATKRRLEFVIANSPAVIYTRALDGHGATTYVSNQAAAILGFAPQEILDQPRFWAEQSHPDDAAGDSAWLASVDQTDDCWRILRLRQKTGGYRWFRDQAVLGRDSHGAPVEIIGSIMDITELKEHEQGLILAKEAAETANRSKTMFLSQMGHEIRTPLNPIVGYVDYLLNEPLAEDHKQCLLMIKQCGNNLLRMLDDLLDLSRIEAGKLTLRSTEISPAVLLSEAIGIFAPRAAAKQVALRSTLQPEVPAFVLGDPLRLHQILWNFLSNAIKFTERGEVVLDVRVRDTRPDPPRVELEFTVSDTGIGIPPERMQDVFLPFVQADDSIQLRFGGTGLGLAIAQRLAQLMGGRIWAESQVGQGTVMHFVAPFEVA